MLWNLPTDELKKVHSTLKADLSTLSPTNKNYDKVDHLVNHQIATWLLDSYI